MTNLQDGAPRISGQNLQRIWLWTPIGIGALIAALLVLVALLPIARQFLQDSRRLQKLDGLLQETSLLRSQLQSIDENQVKSQLVGEQILGLIAGSGELSTFLAQLQLEAQRTGVQLDSYEPQIAKEAPAKQAAGARPSNAAAAQPRNQPDGDKTKQDSSGPPELQGLQRQTSLLIVKGQFPALLAFLKRVETLNVLVVQSDLNLSLPESATKAAETSGSPVPVILKLNVSLYGPPEKDARPGAPAPK